jgi:hypothetical protein
MQKLAVLIAHGRHLRHGVAKGASQRLRFSRTGVGRRSEKENRVCRENVG